MRRYGRASGQELDVIASVYGLNRGKSETDVGLRARIRDRVFDDANMPHDEGIPDVPCIGCIILASTISVLMVLFIGFLVYHSWTRLMGAPY